MSDLVRTQIVGFLMHRLILFVTAFILFVILDSQKDCDSNKSCEFHTHYPAMPKNNKCVGCIICLWVTSVFLQ